jgi:hypothetical protein
MFVRGADFGREWHCPLDADDGPAVGRRNFDVRVGRRCFCCSDS